MRLLLIVVLSPVVRLFLFSFNGVSIIIRPRRCDSPGDLGCGRGRVGNTAAFLNHNRPGDGSNSGRSVRREQEGTTPALAPCTNCLGFAIDFDAVLYANYRGRA